MRSEHGQASIEWLGLVLLASLAFGGLFAAAPLVDGRSLGGFLAHRIVCAVRPGCNDGDSALARVYGSRDAALARAYAPSLAYEHGERSLPVDYRRCREHACADAPDDPDLDAHRSGAGQPATAFTRRWRHRGHLYIAYWLYYPDSNTALLGSDKIWNHSPLRFVHDYPGYHPDDWEAAVVRVDSDGSVWTRASSHGHWQACKRARCRNRWAEAGGWTRVSRGSHAGHIPERVRRERTSTSEGLRLVALESLDRTSYRGRGGVAPPWEKESWWDLEHGRP
jgi:hypothetical protein